MVRRCLVDRPLVSLVGPGGVGKTRLALELAHEHAVEGRPVVWVDLSTLEQGRLADLSPTPPESTCLGDRTPTPLWEPRCARRPRCCASTTPRPCWTRSRRWSRRWSSIAPRLRILATSRERLAVHTEHVHRLAPLPLPSGPDAHNPAIRLFLERASGLEEPLTEAHLEDISLLCRRLDGLPLAIELGAAQAPTFGIRQFSDHIAGELDLLAGGRRTAATRHRTLRAVVDASYRLLTPDEATLFVRLAVFPGRSGLRTLRLVCADDRLAGNAVGPLLARLVEQSMVQSDAGRFWLLDTLRTYALERHRRRRAPRAARAGMPASWRTGWPTSGGSSSLTPRPRVSPSSLP